MMGKYMPSALMVATMETEHFTFTACGGTDKTAREYLLATWMEHTRLYEVDPKGLTTVDALEEYYGIKIVRVFAGLGMRDGQQIWTKERF